MNLRQNITSWKDVPTLVLSNIFSYLNLRDRLNASLTCKNWSQIFKSPNIWRRVNVVYYGNTENLGDALDSIPTISNHQTKEFAKVLGRYVQSLTVRFVSCDRLRSDQRVEQLDYCLRSLTQKQCCLEELEIDCRLHSRQWTAAQQEQVVNSFVHFVDSQHHLKKVILKVWVRSIEVRILDALSDVGGNTLMHLECLFHYYEGPNQAIQNIFCNLCYKLPLLQILSLPVESVDDTFVKSLSECLLKTLRIMFFDINSSYEAVYVSADSWIQLCHNLPQLKVEFYANLPRKLSYFPQICLPEVPLVSAGLHINDFILEEDWDINRCINYIGDSFQNTLEFFVLSKESVATPLPLDSMAILTMIDKCTKIRQMALHIPLEVSVIENICSKLSARENCILALSQNMFGEDENEMLTEMKERYQFLHLQ